MQAELYSLFKQVAVGRVGEGQHEWLHSTTLAGKVQGLNEQHLRAQTSVRAGFTW